MNLQRLAESTATYHVGTTSGSQVQQIFFFLLWEARWAQGQVGSETEPMRLGRASSMGVSPVQPDTAPRFRKALLLVRSPVIAILKCVVDSEQGLPCFLLHGALKIVQLVLL